MKTRTILSLRRGLLTSGAAMLALTQAAAAQSAPGSRPRQPPPGASKTAHHPASAPARAAPSQAPQPAVDEKEAPGEAITVSATRRRTTTHDVADSVTVLSGRKLEQLGAQSYEDYIKLVPGATFTPTVPGISTITFRGISTTAGLDQGQGTTGYFLNDIPLTEPGFAIDIPNIDTFDVARVEALRGPQSTLFGSATLGGAIDYIPNQADGSKLDAAAQSTIDGMPGHEVGYGEKGMINIPVIKGKLAIRGVLDYRQDPGYITNLGIGRNTNTTYTRNARASIVFTPFEGTKLAYTYLGQSVQVSDDPYSEPQALGNYVKQRLTTERVYTQTQMHELRLDQDLPFATLSAMAAFLRKGQSSYWDDTPFFGSFVPGLHSPTYAPQEGDSKSMYYEVRLTSHQHRPFTWLIGAAYYDSWKRISAPVLTPGIEPALAGIYGPALAQQMVRNGDDWENPDMAKYDGTEKSISGEMSWRFLKDFTVTGGARVFNMAQNSSSQLGGYGAYLDYGTLYHRGAGFVSQTSALPKFSFKYEPNRQIMAYFQLSEGYRFGAPNTNPVNPKYPTPQGTKSDSLINYEVGTRLTLLHSHLVLEPTLYWIDWSNMQARLARPDGITYGANVGNAVSRGFEFSGTWLTPLPGLSLNANATYTDAHTTQSIDGGLGNIIAKGTQLASSPKWQFSEVLTYQSESLPLHPQFSVVHHYQGSAPGLMGNSFRIGNYNTVDIRVTGRFHSAIGNSSISLYVNNLNQSRGVTMGYLNGAPTLDQIYLMPPRLIGMTLNWHL
ncbi:TonB-dependent receptor [Gluconacetobacter sacchari DSM 12717]|uniref:TonB-dependent receptor n=2 Tax=Gluconacetobacter sacchari TaxID=92759 RepID=A0A7W4NL62_9PROT|nr:TonB-dependent receptor [Gluconacetobacter sacchari]MBB2159806.1 TonB-dependent receptor [Gluconacetobacter sacchari]GBQ21797.1 TonB-dependent receptor [Gluconacetobacter sacchari DSM 12717]